MKIKILIIGIALIAAAKPEAKPSENSDIKVLNRLRQISIKKMQHLNDKVIEEEKRVKRSPDI